GLTRAEAEAIERAVMGTTLAELLSPAGAADAAVVANLVRRASQLRLSGQLEQALAAFEKALAISPDDPVARAGRGEINAALYRIAEAREDFDAALATAPDLVPALI